MPVKSESKFGIVAVVDALGISNLRIDEALDFIQRRDLILKDQVLEDLVKHNAKDIDKYLSKPELFTFGDTIVFAWEILDTAAPGRHFGVLYASDWLRAVMFKSLQYTSQRLFFRGAISIGRYVVDGNGILGPAIADAAAWYSAANWIGIIATPTLAHTINTLYAFKGAKGFNTRVAPRYMKYDVPLNRSYSEKHGSSTLDTWAIAWPYEFYEDIKKLDDAEAAFSMVLEVQANNSDNVKIPLGTEAKYANTIKFFNAFVDWRAKNTGWEALATYHSYAKDQAEKGKNK